MLPGPTSNPNKVYVSKCERYNCLMRQARNYKPNTIVVRAHTQKMFALGNCEPSDE